MVTTRSKTSKLASEPANDSTLLNESVNSRSKKPKNAPSTNYTQIILFFSLLLDLIAFTMILPLFPSLLIHYAAHDGPDGTYAWFEQKIEYFQTLVGAPRDSNLVLFGGFLGSLYSFLQFLASPIIGAISDVYGRKPVIIACLLGLTASYFIWSLSVSFLLFIVARIVGGISKGNLSVSMAAMTDISSSDKRASGMALIGAAFSIAFVIGPLIGAYFAQASHTDMWFVKPAYFALSLVMADLLFVIALFKETLPKEKRLKSVASSVRQALFYINPHDLFMFTAVKNITSKDLKQLRSLGVVFFLYMFLYSGLEFTLTFLTHSKFHYTSMEQGWMFARIGLPMAILQGAWVRRIPPESVQTYTLWALFLIVPAFLCVGLAQSYWLLNLGVFIYSLSTSLAVPCMTTIASKYGSSSQKGTALGIFRSLGAFARAIGPIVTSVAYWIIGPLYTYCAGGVLLLVPFILLKRSPSMKV